MLLACIGGLALCSTLVMNLLGMRVYKVTSGSMEPTISAGDLILTKRVAAVDLMVGDIVTVQRSPQGRSVTHRIVEIVGSAGRLELRLQGDANLLPDPAPYPAAEVQRHVATLLQGATL